jgi:hypothetical protein
MLPVGLVLKVAPSYRFKRDFGFLLTTKNGYLQSEVG